MSDCRKINIAVIDSGIKSGLDFPADRVDGCGILCQGHERYQITGDTEDYIGHGTAVVDELTKTYGGFGCIHCVKVYGDSMETDTGTLFFALDYIDRNIDCDIVLISSGVTFIDRYDEMTKKIDALAQKGVYVISAFDNDGAVSFPAALDSVIGVGLLQGENEVPRVSMDSPVNVTVPNRFYRLKWVSPNQIIISGSSFAAAHIAALWGKALAELSGREELLGKNRIFSQLAHELSLEFYPPKVKAPSSWVKGVAFSRTIKKAVVFPWNKEIHALARFHELLPFTIEGFYDIKYNLHIGKEIAVLLGTENPLGKIRNFDDIDWDGDFDMIICGHCGKASQLVRRNFVEEIVEKAYKHHKRIYGFDPEFSAAAQGYSGLECFVPGIVPEDRCALPGGRLYNRLTPVIGVFGTSSQQGKFTVQLELRKRLLSQGYTVGQIASEPSGYLFQCDGVFPFGYQNNVLTSGEESLAVLNKMLWDASCYNEKEVIIVGGQSGAVPYSHHNMAQYNFKEYEFLCGVNPDVFVLCVNPHDPIEYIRRTINYLYSFNGMPVAAIVLFRLTYEAANQIVYGYRKKFLTEKELTAARDQIMNQTHIPVYILGRDSQMAEMTEQVISALCEE